MSRIFEVGQSVVDLDAVTAIGAVKIVGSGTKRFEVCLIGVAIAIDNVDHNEFVAAWKTYKETGL